VTPAERISTRLGTIPVFDLHLIIADIGGNQFRCQRRLVVSH
jgi:hypothetical protein